MSGLAHGPSPAHQAPACVLHSALCPRQLCLKVKAPHCRRGLIKSLISGGFLPILARAAGSLTRPRGGGSTPWEFACWARPCVGVHRAPQSGTGPHLNLNIKSLRLLTTLLISRRRHGAESAARTRRVPGQAGLSPGSARGSVSHRSCWGVRPATPFGEARNLLRVKAWGRCSLG